MRQNTTGAYNTAVGKDALYANTTGAENAAFGTFALYANTTASRNSAFGNEALENNTTGADNTAFSWSSLNQNTTGSENTAIGRSSLYANTTGIRNTAVGSYAGDGITTGNDNICIGNQAGSYSEDITTGSDNICIGAFSRTQGTSNSGIAIGYDVGGSAGTTTIGRGTADIRTTHGSTSWATVSDERYKKDIVDSTAGLSFVNALRPRTFKYKNLGELPSTFNAYKEGSIEVFKNSNTNHGFIAQEVKTAIDADSSIKDGFFMWNNTRPDGSQEVAETALIPVLVKAIQELSAKNEALLTRIEALEG